MLRCDVSDHYTHLLQDVVLFLSGEAQVSLLTGTELGSLLVKLLLPLLHRTNLVLAEFLKRDNEVVIGPLQHPVALVLDCIDQSAELFQAAGYDKFVICLI